MFFISQSLFPGGIGRGGYRNQSGRGAENKHFGGSDRGPKVTRGCLRQWIPFLQKTVGLFGEWIKRFEAEGLSAWPRGCCLEAINVAFLQGYCLRTVH